MDDRTALLIPSRGFDSRSHLVIPKVLDCMPSEDACPASTKRRNSALDESCRATVARPRSLQSGCCRLLQGRHAACILVECVGKATDNRAAWSSCYPEWLTLILRCDRPVVGPGAFPAPLPALGLSTISTEATVSG